MAHDVFDAGFHTKRWATPVSHGEGEGMSGGNNVEEASPDDHGEDNARARDAGSDIEEVSRDDDRAAGNARALDAVKSLAELVADARGNRRKAQSSVLASLNGKV